MTTTPDTVTEALDQLTDLGYGDDFALSGQDVSCGVCGVVHPAEAVEVDHVYRFEGASDPDDEAIVLGLRCPGCGSRGRFVSGYGPSVEPEVAAALRILSTPR